MVLFYYISVFKKEKLKFLISEFWRKLIAQVSDAYWETLPPNGYYIKLQIQFPKGPYKTKTLVQ